MADLADPGPDRPTRRFGGRTCSSTPTTTTDGGFQGERATLVGYLRDQRLTLEPKCSGTRPSGYEDPWGEA